MLPPVPPVRALILLCVILLTACQSARSSDAFVIAPRDQTRVEVFNDHWEDLTVYLDRDGTRSRLGTVNGNTSRVLKIRDDLLSSGGWVRLVAVETGRRDHAHSEDFAVQRGDRVTWRTGPQDHPTPVVVTPGR